VTAQLWGKTLSVEKVVDPLTLWAEDDFHHTLFRSGSEKDRTSFIKGFMKSEGLWGNVLSVERDKRVKDDRKI